MLCCVLESRIYEFSTVLSEQAPALIAVPQVFKIGSFIFFLIVQFRTKNHTAKYSLVSAQNLDYEYLLLPETPSNNAAYSSGLCFLQTTEPVARTTRKCFDCIHSLPRFSHSRPLLYHWQRCFTHKSVSTGPRPGVQIHSFTNGPSSSPANDITVHRSCRSSLDFALTLP
jgi:hypothetical protein